LMSARTRLRDVPAYNRGGDSGQSSARRQEHSSVPMHRRWHRWRKNAVAAKPARKTTGRTACRQRRDVRSLLRVSQESSPGCAIHETGVRDLSQTRVMLIGECETSGLALLVSSINLLRGQLPGKEGMGEALTVTHPRINLARPARRYLPRQKIDPFSSGRMRSDAPTRSLTTQGSPQFSAWGTTSPNASSQEGSTRTVASQNACARRRWLTAPWRTIQGSPSMSGRSGAISRHGRPKKVQFHRGGLT